MKFLSRLKTSDRISFQFSVFNVLSLIFLVLVINVAYFFVWYNDQKEESLSELNENYNYYLEQKKNSSMVDFQDFILARDTIIIKNNGELICSEGVSKRLHNNIEGIQNRYFYIVDSRIYFVFSKKFAEIGEVKVLFDTTSYGNSQMIIIKTSLVMIFIWMFLSFFITKLLSRYVFRDLRKISDIACATNIDNLRPIESNLRSDDEIQILVDTINHAFAKIDTQTSNLKQFITDVSHEFKTPLMAINSRIDLYNKKCEKGVCGVGELKQMQNDIKKSTLRLNKLLETMLLLSRKTEQVESLETAPVNVYEYIEQFCETFTQQFGGENIDVKISGKKKIVWDIEPTTFDVILENFLTNAIKFKRGSTVKINIQINDSGFTFTDKGIGVDAESLDKIWTRFYRHDTKLEGFGVGLFLVKRIVDLYGWSISVDSQRGKYTKFSINF